MSQVFFMIILFTIILLRAIYMRKQAFILTPSETCTVMGGWILIITIAGYPFFSDLAHESFDTLKDKPYFIAIAFLKGIGLWVINYARQVMCKTSSSSTGFYGFICIGIIAVGNSMFGESLSTIQWVSVALLTLTGVYFTFKGHLSTQSPYIQLMFMLMVAVGCMFGMIDHYFITHINWYGLLFLSGLSMFLFALVIGKMPLRHVGRFIFSKNNIKFGLMVGFTEVMILSILVTHVPVTLAWVAMTLSAPILMVISSVFWGEGRWQEQLLVGGVSYAAAIPIVVGL